MSLLQTGMLRFASIRDLAELRESMGSVFHAVIPGDRISWGEGDFGGPERPWKRVEFWETPKRLTPALVEKLSGLMGEHPFNTQGIQKGNWGPLILSDFLPRGKYIASALWREVYKHIGVGRLMSIGTIRGNRIGTLSISRPLRDPDFSERDRLAMRLLVPHFVQALRDAELQTARRDSSQRSLAAMGLTPREIEVSAWIAQGRTNPEIAKILGMRPRTVEKHVENILNKLGVENRTAAAIVVSNASPTLGAPAVAPH